MKYLELAKVVNTHGLSGEIKVLCTYYGLKFNNWKPNQVIYLKENDYYLPLRIKSVRLHKNFLLLTFENFEGIDSVISMKKKSLVILNEDNDEDFSFENLIDYQVINNQDQKILGSIVGLVDNNHTGLWEVINDQGKTFYVPNNHFFIIKVDKKKKKVYLNLISGMFNYE